MAHSSPSRTFTFVVTSMFLLLLWQLRPINFYTFNFTTYTDSLLATFLAFTKTDMSLQKLKQETRGYRGKTSNLVIKSIFFLKSHHSSDISLEIQEAFLDLCNSGLLYNQWLEQMGSCQGHGKRRTAGLRNSSRSRRNLNSRSAACIPLWSQSS